MNFFETEAQKKKKKSNKNTRCKFLKIRIKNLKDGELLDVDKQMNKFKKI